MFCFKFHQNRTINEELDFFEGGGAPRGLGGLYIHKFISQLLLVNIRKCCFKFHQNRTINKEFYFWGAKFFRRAPRGQGARFQKIEKVSYRSVVPSHTKNFSILAQLEKV